MGGISLPVRVWGSSDRQCRPPSPAELAGDPSRRECYAHAISVADVWMPIALHSVEKPGLVVPELGSR
jgi:hypothetical protein